MHAAVLILIWLIVVASLQMLDGVPLFCAVLAIGVGARLRAHERMRRLLRRVRILLLAIFVMFAGFTPGEAVWPVLAPFGPSREGLLLAFEHAGRLVAAVFLVALLLQQLPPPRLVGGVHALLRPFSVFGLQRDRVAVRAMLVLGYVEAAAPRNWRDWLQDRDDEHPEPVVILHERLRVRDGVALGLVLGVAGLAGLAGMGWW